MTVECHRLLGSGVPDLLGPRSYCELSCRVLLWALRLLRPTGWAWPSFVELIFFVFFKISFTYF